MRTADWTGTTSVLDRVTAVLDAFDDVDDDGLGITEIARRANLPKSTVSRIASDLVRQRYLDREGSRLHLGSKLFELGRAVERPVALGRIASPIMYRLRAMTGESVRLAVLDGQHIVRIASITGRADRGGRITTGARSPAHASALGRAILANSSDEIRTAAIRSGPPGLGDELREIRRAGVASDQRTGTAGRVSVASAICVPGAAPLGAIDVAGPAEAIDVRRVGGLVRAAAMAVSGRWVEDSSS